MVTHLLCAWIGQHDLNAAARVEGAGLGPIGTALETKRFEQVVLLSNYDAGRAEEYCAWAEVMFPGVECKHYPVELSSPTAYGEIYRAADGMLQELPVENAALFFHLSPGTPAMAAVWILLASGKYKAKLVETHPSFGLREVELPFDIMAQYRPGKGMESHISLIDDRFLPESPAFEAILHRSAVMERAVAKAKRAAVFEVPVLLLGESGTGKELFAKAIHSASVRSKGPFIAVNCGAIPESLAESVLFGHAKGAFTGAAEAKAGSIEEAHGGTLFLDEIGELSPEMQVRLLRTLNDRTVQRVGETRLREVDFRLISATNRDLAEETDQGRFRSDLFHRIAVGVIKLPPLRERGEDLPLLIEHVCARLNAEFASVPGWQTKRLSVAAVKRITAHQWPGNVRELINTITRAFVFSGGTELDETAIGDAVLVMGRRDEEVLDRPLGNGFSIEEVIASTAGHYLERAMKQAGGNKTQAAKLLGLNSYQTLTNWLERYGSGDD